MPSQTRQLDHLSGGGSGTEGEVTRRMVMAVSWVCGNEYTHVMNDLFSALFEPRRLALIGASADEKKTTSRPQRFLNKHGFTGEILPVNPGRTEIMGAKAYKSLEAIEGEIDHAYILLNGKDAVEALAACGRRGVKVASILAGGFADAGAAGASLQDGLVRIVKETGIRLVGPNSIGTVSTDPAVAR